jgi:hypothetical protein
MPTSSFLAKLIGPVALAIGVGLIANGAAYRRLADEFLRSTALIYLSGLLALSAGLAIVLAHNVWTADWRVLITVLGWLAVLGGVVRIVLPQGTEAIGRRVLQHPQSLLIAAVIWLAIGAVLSFFGYVR